LETDFSHSQLITGFKQDYCPTKSSSISDLVVVFGPRTTLAKHILNAEWAKKQNLLLVARDEEDAIILGSDFSEAQILPSWMPENKWECPDTCGCITILLCAFGVIHPVPPDWSSHCDEMNRDIDVLSRILQKFRGQMIRLLFVSSVLALAPRPQRSYYVGWKCLSEAVIRDLYAKQEGLFISVVYPGRLVSKKSVLSPLSFFHTTYGRFAQRLTRIADTWTVRREIVGLDARILLVLKAFGLFMHAVFK
jgi:hypothetical protein